MTGIGTLRCAQEADNHAAKRRGGLRLQRHQNESAGVPRVRYRGLQGPGRVIRSEARGNLAPLFKLVHVVLECANQPSFRRVGAETGNRLPDILVDGVGNPVQGSEFYACLLWSVGLHQFLGGVRRKSNCATSWATPSWGSLLGRSRSRSTAFMVGMSCARAKASAWSLRRTPNNIPTKMWASTRARQVTSDVTSIVSTRPPTVACRRLWHTATVS